MSNSSIANDILMHYERSLNQKVNELKEMGYTANDICEELHETIDTVLQHYGMPRRSGRYPWGSGEVPFQHSKDFLSRVRELKDSGYSETEIAKELNLSTTEYRVQKSLALADERSEKISTVKALQAKGLSNVEIGKKMGIGESSVRSLLNEEAEARTNSARKTADYLKKIVDEKGMLDVGKGVELECGVSREKFEEALYILEREGYGTFGRGIQQVTNPGQQSNTKILCPPSITDLAQETTVNGKTVLKPPKEIFENENINSVSDYDEILVDGGKGTRKAFEYPSSLDSKRLDIRYAEDGGKEKDGVIELRRGVEDLSLGESHYAQVRILVDGKRYLKGMAVYSDDLPEGVDVRFNTNKTKDIPKEDVLKKINGSDPNNPFNSLIKEKGGQSYYDDPNGKFVDPVTGKKQSLSLINKRADEGDWGEWANGLPSQFLSKQNQSLINQQLKLAKDDKAEEFEEIRKLTNPTVKRALLQSFADDCDTAAVKLKAASLPRQQYQVIMPIPSLKDTEVYAPNYRNGETVALIRYPHGGTFEIPILKVNNKSKEGIDILGKNPKDAVGINSKVAARLSGADFDGDTVMVIPCNSSRSKIRITSTPPLKGLEGFDPSMAYPERKGMKYMTKTNTQREMGIISNLITDMTLKGATNEELARAVKHSMVVIDAEKHKLDYKRSEVDNSIDSLKKKYQRSIDISTGEEKVGGASTLISRAKSKAVVDKRKGTPNINQKGKPWYDPTLDEGALIFKSSGETYKDSNGKVRKRTQNSTKMYETRDARSLISLNNTPQERAYADYANYMKSLANKARKEMVYTGRLKYNPSAKETYKEEVGQLLAALDIAKRNAPKERKAQRIASSAVEAAKERDRDLAGNKKELKKLRQIELTKARNKVGAKRHPIDISEKQWKAIQSGAISDNKLQEILRFADTDKLRKYATPRKSIDISPSKQNLIRSMKNSGYTNEQIAERLSVSTSTVQKYL